MSKQRSYLGTLILTVLFGGSITALGLADLKNVHFKKTFFSKTYKNEDYNKKINGDIDVARASFSQNDIKKIQENPKNDKKKIKDLFRKLLP